MKDEDVQTFMRETVNIIQHMSIDIVKLQSMMYNSMHVESTRGKSIVSCL